MKPFQILLLNVATVVVALVIYEQTRGETSPSPERAAMPRAGVADTAALERRLDALDARFAALPPAEEAEPGVLARLTALAAAVRARAPQADVVRPGRAPEDERPPAASPEPTEAEIREFRRLREAVRREDTIEKNRARVDRALDGLSINLTKTQRRKIHAAYAAFEPRINQIWGAIKTSARETQAAGGQIDGASLRVQGATQIQEEFAASLTGVLHLGDAQAVAAALHPAPGKR